jgi:class 3 adenylate cyclase
VAVSMLARASDTAPLAYTPPHLSDKILASRQALEGERKQVTVLFADIKDSTDLIHGLDPEAAQQLLDPVIHMMMDAVHRFEGTVNQVLGDGIMALFGAPIAHEDHALRACYAALAMQTAVPSTTEAVHRTRGLELCLRVGLNSRGIPPGAGEEAWQHARPALDLARQHKERANEALALHQLGVVQAHTDPPGMAPAEDHYQQALAEGLGIRPLQAHCHYGPGRLYSQTGRGEQARAELSTALAPYRAMDMTFWLPQAEAVLAQVP